MINVTEKTKEAQDQMVTAEDIVVEDEGKRFCYNTKNIALRSRMRPLKLYSILFLISSFSLNAYDLSHLQDIGPVCETNKTVRTTLSKDIKDPDTNYEKFERKFSEYDDTWFEDMFFYSIDMFIPDEVTRIVKDVLENRQDEGFGDQTEEIPQTLANDSYNMLLGTAYYYMQDMARITERVWKNEACNPAHFAYNRSIEPKVPLLDLNECDPLARGVSKNGVVLPFNENFPNALYPYAAKPDGCSAEGLQDLYDQSNDISDDDEWLKKACDRHDECYYTEGTTSKACNSKFIVEIIDACNSIKSTDTIKYMGMKNSFCGIKGLLVASGANACARRYFAHAQKMQRAYNLWVQRYEKAYFEAKEQQILQKKGH